MAKKDKRFKYEPDADRPVTISVRIPQELYDRLESYRKQHRQSVSELVRDGIEMRLEVEADPRSRRAESTLGDTEFQIDGASILREIQTTLARHEARFQAIERQTTPGGNGAYDSNTTMPATDVALSYQEASYTEVVAVTDEQKPKSTMPATVPPVGEAETETEIPHEGNTVIQHNIPAYDTTKFYLGTLCPKGHDFGGTGQSLLRKHNQRCRECENEGKREARAKKRTALKATTS